MTAGAMSDGSPVSPELDARLLADLREWRARLAPTSLEGNRWSARLTIDELDMLLRVAAERDALKAAAVAEWEADIPAEIRARAAALPAGHALVDGVVVPLPVEPAYRAPGFCSRCGGRLYYSAPSHAWVHSGAVPKGCVPRPTPRPDRAS